MKSKKEIAEDLGFSDLTRLGVSMKTIKQIANALGVSKQAVYKRYKGKLYTELLPYIHIKDGTTYIAEQGEDIIKSDFLKNSDISNGASTERIQTTPTDTVTDTLIQMLRNELEAKNKQIEELTATIRIQAESIKAAHHNELAETVIDGQKMLSSPAPEKVSLWSKLFRSKGGQK